MRNFFIFGGLDSRDYGIYISGRGTFDAPEREYNPIAIPGRNGNLLGYEKRMSNIKLTYPAFIYKEFKSQVAAMRSAFLSLTGYQRLEDSYHPDEFRLAYFAGGTKVEATTKNDAGNFDLEFQCKPQRYLKSGQTAVSVASGGSITNPTKFDARPLIKVTGYGDLRIGNDTITIEEAYSYVHIDSDAYDCYYGLMSANRYVSFTSNDFPVLAPGSTSISYDNTITEVEITPRWWRV